MDSVQKKRIVVISVGVIFVAIGIFFATSFPALNQYSYDWILSGFIGIVIGFLYPFPKITVKKPRMWYERETTLKDTESGQITLVGIILLLSSLILGLLAYVLGAIAVAIILGGLLFLFGLVFFVIGAVLITAERLKETQ